MTRLLIPVALAALLSGCVRTAVENPLTSQPLDDSLPLEVAAAPTTIVREIHYQAPEVYVDTVYLEYEPPAETVYVEEPVYIEEPVEYVYESYVFVDEPPYPHHHPHPRMSPPEHGRHGSGHGPRGGPDPRRGQEPRERGQRPPDPPGGGGQPRQPDPPETPRPVVGPTDAPKRTPQPRPAAPTPKPTVQEPVQTPAEPAPLDEPAAPSIQSPAEDVGMLVSPARPARTKPADKGQKAEQGS